MASSGDRNWVDYLARALAQVGEAEKGYLEELAERRWQRERSERNFPSSFPLSDPARDLHSFYHHARYREGRYFEKRYAPLRHALQDLEHVLGQHPALAAVAKADKRGHEFRLRILNRNHLMTCIAVVAGLMGRARQAGENGFWVASRELEYLLDPSLDDGVNSEPNDLAIGYHVSLFCGLRLSEGVAIADGMKAVPLETNGAFLNRDVLQNVTPSIIRQNRWKGVGAILKPFPWKPILLSPGDQSEPQLDWGGSFRRTPEPSLRFFPLPTAYQLLV